MPVDPLGTYKPESIRKVGKDGNQAFVIQVMIDGNMRDIEVTLDDIQCAINNQAIIDQIKESTQAISGPLQHLGSKVEELWRAIAASSGIDMREFRKKMEG